MIPSIFYKNFIALQITISVFVSINFKRIYIVRNMSMMRLK